MRFVKGSISIIMMFAVAILMTSCSSSSKMGEIPISPNISDMELPTAFGTEGANERSVLAVYDAEINTVTKSFTITPTQRIADYHCPLSQLYPNVLQITGYGWTPNFWADIKLTHPFPGSGIKGYDPRVIAVLPANPGVSMNYPVSVVFANNSVVLAPDGYTKLYDNLGGSIPGNTNPFKAYFKGQSYRVWPDTGTTFETQRWQMNLAGFGGSLQYKLIVDVSTNFPNPPTPVTDNAPEPVKIETLVGSGLTQLGGSAEITVTILDWQGRISVGGVQIEAPDLFNGLVNLTYYSPGTNPNEYVYKGTIFNEKLAPAGQHFYLISAWDQATGICVYKEFSVSVIYVSPEGSLIWAKRAGGWGNDYGHGITTLSDESIVGTGYFWQTVTFGQGEPNQTTLSGGGMYIARYNSDGTLSWVKKAGGTDDDGGRAITTLSDDSTVVTGFFYGAATFGLNEPNQITLNSAGYRDIFIARYNPNGTLAWAKSAGGASDDLGYGITRLSDNSIVITGGFYSSSTFGLGELNQTILTSSGYEDIFVARYNSDGTLAWAKQAGGTGYDGGGTVTRLSDDSIVVTGSFEGASVFGPGEPNERFLWSAGQGDLFVARYNTNGILAWVKRAGGLNRDGGGKITTLSDESTVVTGFFEWNAIFGQDEPNQTTLTSQGYQDIFLARFHANGSLVWAKRAGGSMGEAGYAITRLPDNSTVITGEFNGSATFGKNEPNQTVLTSSGGGDIFIARYNPDGSLSWAKRAGSASGEDVGRGIASFPDYTTTVIGWFSYSAIFGPDEPNEKTLTSSGGFDIFVARFNP